MKQLVWGLRQHFGNFSLLPKFMRKRLSVIMTGNWNPWCLSCVAKKPLKIHCHEALDIVTAIRICDEFHLRFTLDHVTSGTDILEFLRKRPEIPLLVGAQPGEAAARWSFTGRDLTV